MVRAGKEYIGNVPDLLPALAVTAWLSNVTHAVAKGAKERSSTIANDINAIGGKAQVLSDSLVIYPVNSFDGASTVVSYGDPRIVMAMALASLRCSRGLTIENCGGLEELFPDFFDRFSHVTS